MKTKTLITTLLLTASASLSLADAVVPPIAPATPAEASPKTDPTQPQTKEPNNSPPQKTETKRLPHPDHFVPIGGLAHLTDPADLDLFTKAKAVGHVQDNPKLKYRRLIQRTIMPTEPRPYYGAVLTFDDQLVGGAPSIGSAIDIAKEFAPLHARAIFFANVNGLSTADLHTILKQTPNSEKRLQLTQQLLDSKKKEFIATIRALLKIQSPADTEGNRQFTCEVFNHTAFHQDMSHLKLGSDQFKMCLLGIRFIEQCLDAAYLAERPGWRRARYFRFPFLHTPKSPKAKAVLNTLFTELGLISLGETQDSKDYHNLSATKAYRSLKAAQKGKRYSIKNNSYGKATHPIALFHTKTWPKIRKGVLKAIKEAKKQRKINQPTSPTAPEKP